MIWFFPTIFFYWYVDSFHLVESLNFEHWHLIANKLCSDKVEILKFSLFSQTPNCNLYLIFMQSSKSECTTSFCYSITVTSTFEGSENFSNFAGYRSIDIPTNQPTNQMTDQSISMVDGPSPSWGLHPSIQKGHSSSSSSMFFVLFWIVEQKQNTSARLWSGQFDIIIKQIMAN